MKTSLIRLLQHRHGFTAGLCVFGLTMPLAANAGSPPVVSNVTAAQQAGSKNVNISYIISDPDSSAVNISILVSKDSGATWTVPATSFSGNGVPGMNIPVTSTPTTKSVVWNAGADWDGHYTANCRVRVVATDFETGLTLIPGGSYLRGNPPALGDTDIHAPQSSVNVSAFYMNANLVSGGFWNLIVEGYASTHGYDISSAVQQNPDSGPSFKAPSHPVQTVTWYDAVKWCNARSEMEGLTPCYYTADTLTTVYRSGQVSLQNTFVKWNANGYRLPTETEWEKAARGGLTGRRFPWVYHPMPLQDLIDEGRANYFGDSYDYDLGPYGYNSTYASGGFPYTSPVGSFAANGYGLYDMAGNVAEWCWDWIDFDYSNNPGELDPHGTGSGTQRVIRGGSWASFPPPARCAHRNSSLPTGQEYDLGFRCVRGF